MLSTLSGLRRNDGSLVPIPEGMTSTTTPLPSPPRKDPRTTPLAQNEFGFNKRFANQEAFDSAYQNYLDTYKDDYSQYGLGNRRAIEPIKATPIGGMPLPEGVQIGFGPKRGGYFYGDGTPYNPPGSLGTLGPDNIANIPMTPINNTGIGSLTQNPINTTPESNMTGSMTSSGYLNNNQDLDQYLNSYVENLINRRMRDIFGGIMSIFQ